MARPITFLSDYGLADPFVGVCQAVIARIAPDARVIDLSHGIRRHDVHHGGAVLAEALDYAPAGVHLAVVDPGVGSERRAVAIRVADDERLFVGPDNGLLSAAIERFGGAVEAVEISQSAVRLEPVSATFHGRDLFAPVAAHLALGAELAALGDALDPAGLVAIERPEPTVAPGSLVTAVSHVDSFGNATLIAAAEAAIEAGLQLDRRIVVATREKRWAAIHATTFTDAAEGALLLYTGAGGSLALAVNRGSAAAHLGLSAGDEVELSPA